MKILFVCPIWGMVPDYVQKIEGSLPTIFEKIKNAGFNGIEMAIPFDEGQKQQIIELASKFELAIVALQYAANGTTVDDYLASYKQQMASANDVKPLFINSHTGKDYFSVADNHTIIAESISLSKKLDVKIMHETHRGRFSFHAATTQQYIQQHPELRLVADFSHWCNVSESLLEEQEQNVLNAIERTDHIHARVGFIQGPQVNDPRAPEWQQALQAHLNWWDKIVQTKKQAGHEILTITPEFGPPPYMPVTPYHQEPLASQWDINFWMKNFLKSRYS